MSNPYTLTNESLTVVVNGKAYTVKKSEPTFAAARTAVLNEDWDALPKLLSPGLGIEQWAKGLFTVVNGMLTYQGENIPTELYSRILAMVDKKDDPSFLLRFWERLQQNPSMRSVKQLYSFLSHQGIPIDSDGFILAYKAVNKDYTDVHSGTIFNRIDALIEYPRNKISDDPNHACHEGLHAGALAYAQSFGPSDGRILILRIDPADVVCIPYDSTAQKMRTCRYTVKGHYSGTPMSSTNHTDDTPAVKAPQVEAPQVKASVKPLQIEVAKPEAVKTPRTKTSENDLFPEFDDMDTEELLLQSTGDLRSYAACHLHIVGASKIVGGKEALVKRILEVR